MRARALAGAVVAAGLAVVALGSGTARADNTCGGVVHEDDCGKNNIYPCCDNGGNCTWWAWEATCRNWHVGLVNWGNANTWAGHASVDPDYDVVSSPVVGSIATRDLGQFGHVAWVIDAGGGAVTVTEENCCTGCAPGERVAHYSAGYFDSGYVVRHGVSCECSPGQTESQACGDCGSQSRGCDGCNWGGWSGCGGPDPNGGNTACDSGGVGACADGRVRCVGGNTACEALSGPTPEVCDGIDNDCNGEVDDGHPPLGANPPAFAAALVDVSYPASLRCGEHATVWALFRNVGTTAWERGSVWLGADGKGAGEASALFAPASWPAWNVAAVLDTPVPPGGLARFAFEASAPMEAGDVAEHFQLQRATGERILCPEADIAPVIHVMAPAAGAGGSGGAGGAPDETGGGTHGCAVGAGGDATWGAALAFALLALSRGRRRGSVA